MMEIKYIELFHKDGKEVLDIETLSDAYKKRMTLLHDYIIPKKKSQTSRRKQETISFLEQVETYDAQSISEIVNHAKDTGEEVIECLKRLIVVEGVAI